MKITVVGAGSWGTAFSRLTALTGHATTLWVRRSELARTIRGRRVNEEYLPNIELPESDLRVISDLSEIKREQDLLVFVVPSFAMRETAEKVADKVDPEIQNYLNLAKGMEKDTFSTMSEVLGETLDDGPIFTLSGPSHAEEVAKDYPTAVVLAGNISEGRKLQRKLSTDRFRIYLSEDLKGVEYCGTVKNIIAVASGIVSGQGFGDNTTGSLLSRGLAEMVRFGEAFDVKKETFFGLAGVGDLIATCTSEHSRNRRVGYRIGRGEKAEEILESMNMVAEGVYATEVVRNISLEEDISMPITGSLYRILNGESEPEKEITKLMTRQFKEEDI